MKTNMSWSENRINSINMRRKEKQEATEAVHAKIILRNS